MLSHPIVLALVSLCLGVALGVFVRRYRVSHHGTAALASLDDETRMVLVSHYFGGQNLEDVASELGRSKATVTRIHHAGLRQLAELLGDVRASAPSPSLSPQPSNQRRAPE